MSVHCAVVYMYNVCVTRLLPRDAMRNRGLRDISESQDYRLFNQIQIVTDPQHCLNSILPPVRTCVFGTRDRGHPYELPCCKYNAHKQSFFKQMSF